MQFNDHFHAGDLLAEKLAKREFKEPVVFGIPGGGVPVGLRVAERLSAPFYILVVHKIGMADNPEVAIGAVTSLGETILNEKFIEGLGYSQSLIDQLVRKVQAEVKARVEAYGEKEWGEVSLEGRTVILADDGLATGYTMLAAIQSIRRYHPRHLIAVVPTAHREAVDLIRKGGVEVLCPDIRSDLFFAVSQAYLHWKNWETEAVKELLVAYRLRAA